jgi:hypothetical protein
MITTGEKVLHARNWPALIPLVLAVIIFIFFSPQHNDATMIVVCGFLVLAALFMRILLASVRIIMDDSGLNHKTLFRSRTVAWKNISKTYLRYRHHGKSGGHYWFFEDADEKRLRFPLRLFSRRSLQELAAFTVAKRKEAIFDERILNMAEGRFPWYIF